MISTPEKTVFSRSQDTELFSDEFAAAALLHISNLRKFHLQDRSSRDEESTTSQSGQSDDGLQLGPDHSQRHHIHNGKFPTNS
jgi:hypothetical protein